MDEAHAHRRQNQHDTIPERRAFFVDQLATLKITPDQVKFVGISHYHADHTSQLPSLPNATLLIGKGDWEAVNAPKPAEGVNAVAFKHWISGGGKVDVVGLGKDVFGDGTVVMLNTPGHTPGHHSLLVNLKGMGPVVLVGDLAHFHENYESNGVRASTSIAPRAWPRSSA
jgi:glyoxylase-like metal-dependent hydrolase (beta-lactamase superfamily II)